MDFHGIDLNLLVAFDALMTERNVTRAAVRVGVSQPAMSAALARLRTLVGDPLFLRSAGGLLPTARARDMAAPITQALAQIALTIVQKPVFEPATATLTFKLAMPDYPGFFLLPALVQALENEAPGILLNVHAAHGRDASIDLLDAGAVDAAIIVAHPGGEGHILRRPLLRDAFVTIVASGHPAERSGMDVDTWLTLRHILVSPEGHLFGAVDQALAQLGKKRTLALTLPLMFAVPGVVARTLLTATVLSRVVTHAGTDARVATFVPPVALPEITFELMWHRRSDAHPAQGWFRDFIARHAAGL